MFVFDPAQGWTNGFQFEADLAAFFAAHGYEANLIQTQGNSDGRAIFLSPIEEAMPTLDNKPDKTPQQAMQTIKKQLTMREMNFRKGGK